MEAKLPDCMERSFLQKILRTKLKDDTLTIEETTVTPATAAGDGYMSRMLRCALHLQGREDMSIIVKVIPNETNMNKFVSTCDLFVVETRMLTETMPRIHQLLIQAGIPRTLCADVYYHQGPPEDLIVMEDLCKGSYTTADRSRGLDMDHAKVVLESLATLHAGSLALFRDDPVEVLAYKKGFYEEENQENITLTLLDAMRKLGDEVATWEDTPKVFSEKIKQTADVFFTNAFDAFRRDDVLSVVVHGDPWTNNIMFKYSEGKPVSLKFVDFQLTSYRSPVIDLLYLFFSSPTDETCIEQVKDYLRIYHSALVDVCAKLQVPLKFSLDELEAQFQKRLFYGFFVASWIFPITIAPSNSIIDPEELLDDSNVFTNVAMYRNERFKRIYKWMLNYFVAQGAI